MSLDSLAEAAANALHRQVDGRDLDPDLARLRRASRHRSRTQVIAGAATVLLLVVGWLVTRPAGHTGAPVQPHPAPSPIRLHANGPIMGFANGRTAGSGGTSVCAVVAVDPSTGNATRQSEPTPGPCDTALAWSPDGRDLAELSQTGRISVRAPVSDPSRSLASCAHCTGLTWSPDGTTLAAGSPDGILLVDISTGTTHTIMQAGTNVWNPSWSPDGRQIAYAHGHGPFKMSLDVVGVDGTGLRTLVPVADPNGLVVQVAWSPTGRQIAVLALGAKEGAQTWPVRILSVDPRDGAVTVLHDSGGTCYCLGASPSLSWAPDGTELAAWMPLGPVDKQWTLYTMRSDGSGLHRVPGDQLTTFVWWRAGS